MLTGTLLLFLALLPVSDLPVTRMTLKNGTVYLLKDPPSASGGRIIFTTVEGKVFSLAESEVATIGSVPAPTPAPRGYNVQDSRELGAIARQQRARRGKTAEVAPGEATKKPVRAKAVKRTPGSARKTSTPHS